jgi:citrate lyase gamma subunit
MQTQELSFQTEHQLHSVQLKQFKQEGRTIAAKLLALLGIYQANGKVEDKDALLKQLGMLTGYLQTRRILLNQGNTSSEKCFLEKSLERVENALKAEASNRSVN